ncbi:MAG TPA: hypothetical protein VK968_03045 [Roseimicrobium sp.]|nr:hypothetical protein [Roseimicrobium sp.]
MKKAALIKKIVAELTRELGIYFKAAVASREEATHEQSKAESKYDTRGLEASYLARGQSKQAAEIEQAIEEFTKMTVRKFAETDPVDLGALIELEMRGEKSFYFIGPRAGGTEVIHEKQEVLVITPQSPLGQQVMGKKAGTKWKSEIAGAKNEYRLLSVQ